jgi:hypothetical protein
LRIRLQTLGLRPKPHKPFEKGLIQNLQNKIVAPQRQNFGLAETPLRWPRQDDGAASGSRAELVRVKPDKHRPVLWDERKLPKRLPVADKRK